MSAADFGSWLNFQLTGNKVEMANINNWGKCSPHEGDLRSRFRPVHNPAASHGSNSYRTSERHTSGSQLRCARRIHQLMGVKRAVRPSASGPRATTE